MAKARSLVSQEHTLIRGLCDTSQLFNGATTVAEREQGYWDLWNLVCEYVSNRYPHLVIEEALKPTNAVANDPLSFLDMHLDLLQREKPLTSDFLRWLVTKLILTTGSIHLQEEVVANIRRYCCSFISKLLPEAEQMPFLVHIIDQLREYSTIKQISLWEFEAVLPASFIPGRSIPVEAATAKEKENVIATTLELLLSKNLPLQDLSDYHQCVLWMITIEHFSVGSISLKKSALRIWKQLLLADVANYMVCRLAIDRLLQMEVIQEKSSLIYDRAKTEFFEVLFDAMLHFDERKSLQGVDLRTIIYWAETAAAVFVKAPEQHELMLRFSRSACQVLTNINLDQDDWLILSELRSHAAKVISHFFSQFREQETDVFLEPFVSLLLQTNDAMDDSWIHYVATQHTSSSDLDRLILSKKFISVLQRCKSPKAKVYLQKLAPTQDNIMKFVEDANSRGNIQLLLTLISIVGDLTIADCIAPAVSLPFLSLPWLSNDTILSAAVSRRHPSIPALKDFNKFASFIKKLPKEKEEEARISSIVPLTKISKHTEWRRQLYSAAMKDRNPRVAEKALGRLHEFFLSVGTSSFQMLADAALEVVSLRSDTVMGSLARCICVLDAKSEDSLVDFKCDICRGSGRAIDSKDDKRLETLPETVLRLAMDKWKQPSTATMGVLNLSCSLLFHYPRFIPDSRLRDALVFMENCNEDVRELNLHFFKHIICTSDNPILLDSLQTKLPFYQSKVDDVMLDPFCAKYLTICAQYSKDQELRRWAFGKHYSIILQNQEIEFLSSMRNLVKDIANLEDMATSRVFARRVRTITRELCSHLISFGKLSTPVGFNESVVEEIMSALELTRKIFFFEDVAAMLKIGARYIVPTLLMCNPDERPWATIVVDKIREAMKMQKEHFGSEFFPFFMVQWVLLRGPAFNENDSRFIQATCGGTMSQLSTGKRYLCSQFLLQQISTNEPGVSLGLAKLNEGCLGRQPFTITRMLLLSCEYVGHFLKLRWCLTVDDFYEQRPVLLKSLDLIIRRLEPAFLEDVGNRLMSVLRAATQCGEAAIPVWITFAVRLNKRTFKALLPRILIDTQPLLQYDSSDDLIAVILENGSRLQGELEMEDTQETHERENVICTTVVLIGCDVNGSRRLQKYLERIRERDRPIMTSEKLINTCVRLLAAECETVGKVVLQKLHSLLDGNPLKEDLTSSLIPVLLQTLRRCTDPETRILTVKCFGRLGAVDPGRLEISHVDNADEMKVFVDDKDDFLVDLIERSWKAYSRETEFTMFEQIEYSIQELLTRVGGRSDVLGRLSQACKKDIWPLKSTQLAPITEPKWTAMSPVVNNVDTFSEWLQQCFVMGANRVRQDPIRHVFRALKWIANTRDTLFTRYILPQLILRLIIENATDILDTYIVEMETVLRHVVESGQSWVKLAAHIVFSILDTLEQFAKHRKRKRRGNAEPDAELIRTLEMLRTVAAKTLPDGQLLIVVAAERCNCYYRALKWCEQYAISQENTDRTAYFTLERIYSSLNNVDGVLGAFECLSKNNPPTASERILALEAAGDYHEAMALYALIGQKNEPQMVKCLLRLNQPQLALCTATAAYNQYRSDESMSEILYANQVEAACLLQDWKQLDSLVERRDPLTLGKRTTWGASCASILCAVKRQEPDVLTKRLQLAREILVDQLTAMTIEHSDTYTQAYNYVTQLHILDEIEDSSAALHLVARKERATPRELSTTLTKWQARSENAIQGATSLESILSVRRELLKLYSTDDTKSKISQLLVQSCRLARQAGHLQIAWTFLAEAQSLDVNHKDVGMEQARFEFQKGDQQQAISLLTKLLHGRFNTTMDLFQNFVRFVESNSSAGSDKILALSKEGRASFAEIQLLRAEYMMKAGAVSSGDLYKIYMALRRLQVPSEDLFYRVALFCDGLYSLDSVNVRVELGIVILKTYADALRNGRNHLFHAMPRMLTLWLDCTQKKHEQFLQKGLAVTGGDASMAESRTKDKNDIDKMNGVMEGIFKSLDPYYFYKAYQQLISRIEHKSEAVFKTLKDILAELLVKYPHQCLWLSIAVYRAGQYERSNRQKRCNLIFNKAMQMDRRLGSLIDQYDYISACLIKIAENKTNNYGTFNNLAEQYPLLYQFFSKGIMDTSLLMGAKERNLSGTRKEFPTIMVPLTEMMDYAIPKHVQRQQIESFSQIVIDTASPTEPAMGALPEVLIQKFENGYMVLKSMMQPKRLTIRSQDGRVFHIMAKPNDELRKDARFMDVNRMMNSMMRQNPESRRRQLTVKTFTVIPLQPHGGILEWLPNLIGYRHALQPLFDEKVEKKMTDHEWFKNWDNAANSEDKVRRIQSYYKNYPLVMAEWFRREFVDPSSWHSARSNYARSSAVMSIIGFVLGLGDRHGENILLDQKEGGVVHVDFNLIFNKGEHLPVKEVVPFRLTRNMVDGLGPTGVEGVFRKSCEATLKVMRDNKDTLLTVIQAFVHDPLLEWQNAGRAQQNRARQRGGPAVAPADLAADAVGLIGKRLEGHIVTPEIFRWKFGMSPMSLEGQVNKLIEIATDEKQLVQMYIGWAPFM